MSAGFRFACPVCRTALESANAEGAGPGCQGCPQCDAVYPCTEGIWRMLAPGRWDAYSQFAREYETVRREEGRGSVEAAYYQALPNQDHSGRMGGDWAVRAKSCAALVERVVAVMERERREPLHILDLGAGNCWLSNRLAQRGHFLAAVDLLVNDFDGLGAHKHYPAGFVPVQAEFDCLPFVDGQADLVIFNASFHYSTSYERTLREARRVLSPEGRVVVLDTPLYRDPGSGVQMVHERQAQFTRTYGFPSNALASENFLSEERLTQLGQAVGLLWEQVEPDYGLRWRLRPWLARLRGSREPARFVVLVGHPDF